MGRSRIKGLALNPCFLRVHIANYVSAPAIPFAHHLPRDGYKDGKESIMSKFMKTAPFFSTAMTMIVVAVGVLFSVSGCVSKQASPGQ